MALYRAQIVELDRDLARGPHRRRDHATAMLELQRRLLAASERRNGRASAGPGAAAARAGPGAAAALSLYLVGGRPDLPAQPLAPRMAAADKRMAESARRWRSSAPRWPRWTRLRQAREGELMLGNVEASQGHFAEAAEAWRKALTQRFDPTLAAMVADATSRAEGRSARRQPRCSARRWPLPRPTPPGAARSSSVWRNAPSP